MLTQSGNSFDLGVDDDEDAYAAAWDDLSFLGEAFCPTGDGGGIDNSCSSAGSTSAYDAGLDKLKSELHKQAGGRKQTDSRAFKRWFGNSKIVDGTGRPLVVYHGTSSEPFDEFSDVGPSRERRGNRGHYFTPDPEYASVYSDAGANDRPRRIMPVYVRIENPKVVLMKDSPYLTEKDIERYKSEGYDGLLTTPNVAAGAPIRAEDIEEVIAFDGSQIKSAIGNRGSFDRSSNKIGENCGTGAGGFREGNTCAAGGGGGGDSPVTAMKSGDSVRVIPGQEKLESKLADAENVRGENQVAIAKLNVKKTVLQQELDEIYEKLKPHAEDSDEFKRLRAEYDKKYAEQSAIFVKIVDLEGEHREKRREAIKDAFGTAKDVELEAVPMLREGLDYEAMVQKYGQEKVHAEMDKGRDARKEHESRVKLGFTFGLLDTKEARDALGVYDTNGGHEYEPVTGDLYHVTTAASKVMDSGFKTREELKMYSGTGLGGGADDTISFTDDLAAAKSIKASMREAHQVASGRKTVADMLGEASRERFVDRVINQVDSSWRGGFQSEWMADRESAQKNLPTTISDAMFGTRTASTAFQPPSDPGNWKPHPKSEGWMGGDGKMRHGLWIRDADPDEAQLDRFSFYKTFSYYRQQATGRLDPLFFGSDVAAFSKIDPDEIKIIHAKPKPKVHGYRIPAEKEWRIHTGKAVDIVGVIDSPDVVSESYRRSVRVIVECTKQRIDDLRRRVATVEIKVATERLLSLRRVAWGRVFEASENIAEAFCPTGKDGGVDNSCSRYDGEKGGFQLKNDRSTTGAHFSNKSGKQGTLFGKSGSPGQMNLFDDVGVPDDWSQKANGRDEQLKKVGALLAAPVEKHLAKSADVRKLVGDFVTKDEAVKILVHAGFDEIGAADLAYDMDKDKSGKVDVGMMLSLAKVQMRINDRTGRLEDAKKKAGDSPVLAFSRPGDRRQLIVHPSTRSKGRWQLTGMDDHGPIGHSEYDTRDEAIGSAIGAHPKGGYYDDGDADYELVTTAGKSSESVWRFIANRLLESGGNCGTGHGGFQPDNDCAKGRGGSGGSPSKQTSSPALAPDSEHGSYSPYSTVYIAFRPNQIKSATGNRGTFDPKSNKIGEDAIAKSISVRRRAAEANDWWKSQVARKPSGDDGPEGDSEGDGEDCGTGAGGFKKGNTCATGDAAADRGTGHKPDSDPGDKSDKTPHSGKAEDKSGEKPDATGQAAKRRTGAAVVSIKELSIDPARFQYKVEGVGEGGVTSKFSDVKFNPDFAGTFYAWHDTSDGKNYVINGHHRYELAKRSGFEGEVSVIFINRDTEKQARAFGALINIAQDHGTALDAAKFMRDMNLTGQEGIDHFKQNNVSLKGAIASDAVKLSNLSDKLFTELTYGRLDLGQAKAIGGELQLRAGEDKHATFEAQNKLLTMIQGSKTKLSSDVVREMALNAAMSPRVSKSGGQKGLFGDDQEEEILFVDRAKVQAAVRAELTKDVRGFGAVSSADREDLLRSTGVGSVDSGVAATKRDEAETMRAAFDRETRFRGGLGEKLNEVLNQAAKEHRDAHGKNGKTAVQKRATRQIRKLLATVRAGGQGDAGGVDAGGGGAGGGGEGTRSGESQVQGSDRRVIEDGDHFDAVDGDDVYGALADHSPDASNMVGEAFCPTGEGGGIDNSCSSNGGVGGKSTKDMDNDEYVTHMATIMADGSGPKSTPESRKAWADSGDHQRMYDLTSDGRKLGDEIADRAAKISLERYGGEEAAMKLAAEKFLESYLATDLKDGEEAASDARDILGDVFRATGDINEQTRLMSLDMGWEAVQRRGDGISDYAVDKMRSVAHTLGDESRQGLFGGLLRERSEIAVEHAKGLSWDEAVDYRQSLEDATNTVRSQAVEDYMLDERSVEVLGPNSAPRVNDNPLGRASTLSTTYKNQGPRIESLVTSAIGDRHIEGDDVRAMVKASVARDIAGRLDTGGRGRDTPLTKEKLLAFEDAMEESGRTTRRHDDVSTNVVAAVVDMWASSSGDGNPWSVAVQHAAAAEFGIERPHYGGVNGESFKRGLAHYEEHRDALRAVVRAMYENTQAELKANGIEKVTLFRGISFGQMDLFHGPAASSKAAASLWRQRSNGPNTKGGHVVIDATVAGNPLSSYSYELGTASAFAGKADVNNLGAVVVTEVKREDIFSTAFTGSGCASEREMVVLGRDRNDKVVIVGQNAKLPHHERDFFEEIMLSTE